MLEAGIKGQHTIIVEKENTAAVMKSGTLAVFATPAMIALIEETAWKSVADVAVGISLNVTHLAASPVGMKVTCNTTLVEVDKRRLVFSVEVEDETGKVGEGTHERFIVQAEKFQNKADAKLNR